LKDAPTRGIEWHHRETNVGGPEGEEEERWQERKTPNTPEWTGRRGANRRQV